MQKPIRLNESGPKNSSFLGGGRVDAEFWLGMILGIFFFEASLKRSFFVGGFWCLEFEFPPPKNNLTVFQKNTSKGRFSPKAVFFEIGESNRRVSGESTSFSHPEKKNNRNGKGRGKTSSSKSQGVGRPSWWFNHLLGGGSANKHIFDE